MAEAQQLRSFEGHRVVVRFADGTFMECQLISAPRHGLSTMWVVTMEGDAFISMATVTEVSELADAQHQAA